MIRGFIYWMNRQRFSPAVEPDMRGKWCIVYYLWGEPYILPQRFLSRYNAEREMERFFSEKVYRREDF